MTTREHNPVPLTEDECLDIICGFRWPPWGLVPCPRCGGEASYPERGHRRAILVCVACERKFGQLHSTLFHRTSLPLAYWLHIIYHVDPRRYRYGCGVALARRLGMPRSTTYRLVRRLRAAREHAGHGLFLAALSHALDGLAGRVNAIDPAVYERRPRGRAAQDPVALPAVRGDDPVLAWYLSRIRWDEVLGPGT